MYLYKHNTGVFLIKIIDRLVDKIDSLQRVHKIPGLVYGVVKKYGEDRGGYQAALLTYYGFLSLFPLLLVATSVLLIILHSNPNIREDVISHATQYFPVVGDQLQSNVQNIHGTGVALIIGILLTLWGAKGIADVFQYSLNHIWAVPRLRRPGFPKGAFKSLAIIIIGAIGLVLASSLSGFAASIDRALAFRILSILVSISLLFGLFWIIFKLGLASASKADKKALFVSSLVAAIGIQVLQIVGGYLVTHELSKLRHLYGTFAATLGLLFWIYLQAQVVIYAIEAGMVYSKKLWPRALSDKNLTDADKLAIAARAKKEKSVEPEKIDVEF